MSIILEAFIQAQCARPNGEVPGVGTVQPLPPQPAPVQRRWPLAGGAAAVVAGLVGLAWLQPWRDDAAEPAAAAAPAAAEVAAATGTLPVSLAPAPTGSPAPAMREAAPEALAVRSRPPEPRRKHRRKARGKIKMAAAQAAAVPVGRLYGIGELPPALRAVAEGVAVAGFAHVDGSRQRTAIINNRAVREGDELAGGLRVERIVGDAVVFNLRGYRFRKGRS